MDVVVFSECPTKDYYRSLVRLEEQGKIELAFRDSRLLYLLALKLYGSLSSLRYLAHVLFKKPLDVRHVCLMKEILPSFFAYLTLPFTKKTIVVLFAPYSPTVVYLWLLRKLKRKVLYMTSWPYWDEKRYAHRPSFIRSYFWNMFLYDVPAVTISQKAREGVMMYGHRVVQIPHGVDISLFTPGKKKEDFTVLFVGRLVPEKGIDDILAVARELPEIYFMFVGAGPMAEKLRTCGLPNVQSLGEIRDRERLARLYRESHVLVLNSYALPHWEELFGIVLIEALASGTPIISTDCVGPKEIVKPEFGFLIPQRNKEALKEKIFFFFTHPKAVKEMGLQGRLSVEKRYNLDTLARLWHEVLMEKIFKL